MCLIDFLKHGCCVHILVKSLRLLIIDFLFQQLCVGHHGPCRGLCCLLVLGDLLEHAANCLGSSAYHLVELLASLGDLVVNG